MPIVKESEATRGVYTVQVDANELVTASGKVLPYPTWIGTVCPATGKINIWTPAASVPRDYRAAAEAMLRVELARLVAAR